MDEKFRRQALRMFSYGVYILTSKFGDNYCAATVTWVSQASFFKQTTLENGFINEEEYQLKDNLPILTSVPTYLKCRVLEIMETGDHPIFLAELNNAVVQNELEPLELRNTGWNYGG